MGSYENRRLWMFVRLRQVFAVLICGIFYIATSVICLPSSWAASDCLACAGKALELTKNTNGLKQHEDLLIKNRDYLSKINSDTSASQAIKVKSNILVIVLRIDTFKNNIDVLKKELEVPACKSCQEGKKENVSGS